MKKTKLNKITIALMVILAFSIFIPFIPLPIVYASTTETVAISQFNDDCWFRNSSDAFTTASDYEWIGDVNAAAYDDSAGLRFQDVDVPWDATIESAYLNMTARALDGVVVPIDIYGEDADDTVTFTNQADYEGRDRTSASVEWTPPSWVNNEEHQSPDISSIIQEIVDRVGWSANNSIVLFVRDDDGWGGTEGLLRAYSWDDDPAKCPELIITWTPSSKPVPSDIASDETQAGELCEFSANWTDADDLTGYIFGTNNTGAWTNDTWVDWNPDGSPEWSNVTKTLTLLAGVRVAWRVWANDTLGNWGDTGLQYLNVTDLPLSGGEGDGFFVVEIADAGTNVAGGMLPSYTQSNWYGEENLWSMWVYYNASGSGVNDYMLAWSGSDDNGTTWNTDTYDGAAYSAAYPTFGMGSTNDNDYVYVRMTTESAGYRAWFVRGEFRQAEVDIVWDGGDRAGSYGAGTGGYFPTVAVDNTTRKFDGSDYLVAGEHRAWIRKGDGAGNQWSSVNHGYGEGYVQLELNVVQTRSVVVVKNVSAAPANPSNEIYVVWSAQDDPLKGRLYYNEDTTFPANQYVLVENDGEFSDFEPTEEYAFATASNYLTEMVYIAYVTQDDEDVRLVTRYPNQTFTEIEIDGTGNAEPWVSVSSFPDSTDADAKDKVYVVWKTVVGANTSIWMAVVDYTDSEDGEVSPAMLLYSTGHDIQNFNMYRYTWKESGADYDNIRFIIGFTKDDDDSSDYDVMAIVFDPKLMWDMAQLPQSMSVVLNTPVDGHTEVDSTTITFVFTPTWLNMEVVNASLHISDSWSTAYLNTTTLVSDSSSSISHTFTVLGTYVWNIQLFNSTTSVWATSNYTITLSTFTTIPPIITGTYFNATWFFRSDTHTIHDTLAYRLTSVQSNSLIEDSQVIGTSENTYYGVRIWILDFDGTESELTGGTPEAIVTRTIDGNGEQTATWTCDGYYFVIDSVKIQIYQRFGAAGSWTLRRIHMTKDERLIRFPAAQWTFTYDTNRTTGSTISYLKFGDFSHLTSVDLWYEGVSPWEKMMYWAYKGNLLAFFVVPWTHLIGELFYGMIVLFMAVTTYNRYQSIRSVMVIAWLFGGVGSFLPALLPVAGLTIANLVLALALAVTLYKLFR